MFISCIEVKFIMVKQLIVVKAQGSRCIIKCMEKRGEGYIQVMPQISGFVGREGVTRDKREGDGKTPKGLFKIGHAFGMAKKINTGLKYKRITSKSRWCCNVNSKCYNRWIESRWEKSCEDLWKYKREYRLGAVIEYNMDKNTVSGRGSAIFLHCSKGVPTAGCVAAAFPDIKRILSWLDGKKNPHILIMD